MIKASIKIATNIVYENCLHLKIVAVLILYVPLIDENDSKRVQTSEKKHPPVFADNDRRLTTYTGLANFKTQCQ